MPTNDTAVSLLASRMEVLHEDVSEMKAVLKDLTSAITKLALIEERQTQAALAQERAFTALERIEARVAALERAAPNATRTSMWVDRAVWASLAAAATYVAKKIGLL